MNKFQIIFLVILSTVVNSAIAQKTLNGPFGFDATYYYKDKRNIEWIGTGSSGGIFKLNNDGSASPINDPFGPAHVSWIGEMKNNLIALCDDIYYKLDSSEIRWTKIQDPDAIVAIELFRKTREFQDITKVKTAINGKRLTLPENVNSIHHVGKDSLIICTQSGIYKYDLIDKIIKKINVRIMASDVLQIEAIGKNKLVCLTQDNNLWVYRSGNWNIVFEASKWGYEKQIKYQDIDLDLLKTNVFKRPPFYYYDNGFISVFKDIIVYNWANNIYLVNLTSGHVTQIQSPFKNNLIESYLTAEGIIALGDIYFDEGKYAYKKFYYKNQSWVEDSTIYNSDSLPLLNLNSGYRFPQELPKQLSEKFPRLQGKSYYQFKNAINNKVISIFLNKKRAYLGTSGSGVIMVKFN